MRLPGSEKEPGGGWARRGHEDPQFLHSFASPGSESPANTTGSSLAATTLSPKLYVEISLISLTGICGVFCTASHFRRVRN